MKFLLLIFSLFYFTFFHAKTTTSVQNGNWGTVATWDNGIPACGDTIYIMHVVTVENSKNYSTCALPMFLEIYYELYFSHPSQLDLPSGSGVEIHAGGKINPEKTSGKSSLLSIGGANVWVAKDGELGGPYNFGSPLPVELISFSAIFNDGFVNLYWSTASEINNEIFVVEKSTNGLQWTPAVITNGAGNSFNIKEYFEQDMNPRKGISYYRLSQIDYNGNKKSYNVVPIENFSKENIAFEIFPNPTIQENINITFEGFENQEVLAIVRDIQGKEFYRKAKFIINNHEIQLLTIEHELPSGIYLITASSLNALYSQKVIIK